MPQAIRLLSATWKSVSRGPMARIVSSRSTSSMFMWKQSRHTPTSGPTASASAKACSPRLMKCVSKRFSGSIAMRTPAALACSRISCKPATHHSHSCSGVPSGTTLPTVLGTIVISWPSSSLTIVTQSFMYCTDAARCCSSLAHRLRSARVRVTAPQHVRPLSASSLRTSAVSYWSGSPLISMLP